MKTITTSPLHFTGYPLEWTETLRPKFPNLPGIPVEETKKVTIVSALDVPENWDESWFANYE